MNDIDCDIRQLYIAEYLRNGARVAEEARLESVYTSKAYPEFESRPFR